MTQGLPMNPGTGVHCLTCLCALEVTQEYGGDVRRCPRCGGLWMGRRGMHRLRSDMQAKRYDLGMTWEELGAKLDSEQQTRYQKALFPADRSAR